MKLIKSFRLEPQVVEMLIARAKATGRTLTQIVERAIRQYCKERNS